MQVLFGVVGPDPRTAPAFDRLRALTIGSNPGLELGTDSAPGIRIGHHLRSFACHDEPGGDLTLALDGEIRLIDGTDTTSGGSSRDELAQVAALYRRYGRGAWERLDGSFCLIIRDGRKVRIGFDVGGTRALYWWAADGIVAFHSRLVDLAGTYPGDLAVDPAGVASFLAHSYYPRNATAFRGISLAGAGQVLEIDPADEGMRARLVDHFRYVPTAERRDRRIEVLADEINELLEPAIARSWRSARRPVVPLSGGVDSRYLAAAIARLAGDPSQVSTITWGEDPTRPDSDAVIAPLVAATLGVQHTWYDKPQRHTPETLDQAIYLTSGEGDGALNYPADHEFHRQLAAERGFVALYRGDQTFGEAHQMSTIAGVPAAAGLSRIRRDPVYRTLLGQAVFTEMADAQDALLDPWLASLVSPTPQARLYELKYEATMRREVLPYNSLKHMDFEVHTPLLERRVFDWIRALPDHRRAEKRVFKLALDRRFPELASLPYAARGNLPDWERLARTDPTIAACLRAVCERPGWLHEIGAEQPVIAALAELEQGAAAAASLVAVRSAIPFLGDGTWHRLERRVRDGVRRTPPGRFARERTMERRAITNRSIYNRLSRLAIVHALVGQAQERHANQRVEAA
jgi:asparagine synthetase B (glutamine-hydrolysing)